MSSTDVAAAPLAAGGCWRAREAPIDPMGRWPQATLAVEFHGKETSGASVIRHLRCSTSSAINVSR